MNKNYRNLRNLNLNKQLKFHSFYKLKNMWKKMNLCNRGNKACFERSESKNAYLCTNPNYEINKNQIIKNSKLPENKPNLKCNDLDDQKIYSLNHFLNDAQQLIGQVYIFNKEKNNRIELFGTCTFSIVKFCENIVKGVTCLHVVPANFEEYDFYISFDEKVHQTYNYDKDDFIPKKLGFFKIDIKKDQFFIRKNILKQNEMYEELLFHIKNLQQNNSTSNNITYGNNININNNLNIQNLNNSNFVNKNINNINVPNHFHAFPSLDILIFDIPEELGIDNGLELENEYDESDDFCFYVGYNCEHGTIKNTDDEYCCTLHNSEEFDIAAIVNIFNKSVGIGKVLNFKYGRYSANTFIGASGAALFNSRFKIIGFIGLSLYDKQINEDGKEISMSEVEDKENELITKIDSDSIQEVIKYDLKPCTSEVLVNTSLNFNIFLPCWNMALIQFFNEAVFEEKSAYLGIKGQSTIIDETLLENLHHIEKFKMALLDVKKMIDDMQEIEQNEKYVGFSCKAIGLEELCKSKIIK